MLVELALFAILAAPARAEKKPAPIPLIVDTDDGQALRLKNGKLIYLDELSAEEKDALGLGDPVLLKKGALADERRQVAERLMRGCDGDLKCWRLGMARWEAAGKEGVSADDILYLRKASREADNFPAATEPEQVAQLCDEYDRKGWLNNGENIFYEKYCIYRRDKEK